VILPLDKYSAAEPSVDELVARLVAQAAAAGSALHAGTVGATITAASATMIHACSDGGYRRSCAEGDSDGNKASPRAWVVGVIVGALVAVLLILAIWLCRRRWRNPAAGAHSKLRQQDDAAVAGPAPHSPSRAAHPGSNGNGSSGGGGGGGGSSSVQLSKLAGAGAQPFSIVSGEEDEALFEMDDMLDEEDDDEEEELPTRDDLEEAAHGHGRLPLRDHVVELDSTDVTVAAGAASATSPSHHRADDIESQRGATASASDNASAQRLAHIDPPSRIVAPRDYRAQQRHYEQDEDDLALDDDDDLGEL
jgi:hypothetical protein